MALICIVVLKIKPLLASLADGNRVQDEPAGKLVSSEDRQPRHPQTEGTQWVGRGGRSLHLFATGRRRWILLELHLPQARTAEEQFGGLER